MATHAHSTNGAPKRRTTGRTTKTAHGGNGTRYRCEYNFDRPTGHVRTKVSKLVVLNIT